jgi:putative aminopeptidase FrvX
VLTVAPSVHTKVFQYLCDTAEAGEVPIQFDSASRSTGTDADAFAYSHRGVPTALVSLALRYMHTTVEMVEKADVDNLIKLLYNAVTNLRAGQQFSYF